jgi:predicted DNA-binding transcriptional regulator YafY
VVCVYDALMGKRTATKSVAQVMVALLTQRTWIQADLARAMDLSTEALRKVLSELSDGGVPLTSEKDHPHVYWSVPKTWFPGGVLFRAEVVPDLLRELAHLRRSKARDRLLEIAMSQLSPKAKHAAVPPVVSRAVSDQEEQYLSVVEDAASRRCALWMKYVTASRGGRVSDRHVSVHVIDVGPPARFVATCHRNGDLRWFRVDGIVRARVDDAQAFRVCRTGEVEAFRASSLDGHRGSGPAVDCSFFVREPESSWVANNLLDGMRVETVHGGIRVTASTSALVRLARFIVSLGDAARTETAVVAQLVGELARGALSQTDEGRAGLENRDSSADLANTPAQLRSDG